MDQNKYYEDAAKNSPSGRISQVEALDILLILSRYYRSILATVFIIVAGAVMGSLIMKPTFTATGRILPQADLERAFEGSLITPDRASRSLSREFLGISRPAEVLTEIIRTDSVLFRTIERVKLVEKFNVRDREKARDKLLKALSVKIDNDSAIVTIQGNAHDPVLAATIVNTVIEELYHTLFNIVTSNSEQRRSFFAMMRTEKRAEIERKEELISLLRKKIELLSLQSKLGDQITALDSEFESQKNRLNLLVDEGYKPDPSSSVAENNDTQANSAVEMPDRRILFVEGIQTDRYIQKELGKLDEEIRYYNLFMDLYLSNHTNAAITPRIFEIIDKAYPPEHRTKPAIPVISGLSAVIGLLLGVFIAFVRSFISNASQDPERAAKIKAIRNNLSG